MSVPIKKTLTVLDVRNLDYGFTEKEIDKIMFDAMDSVIVCGQHLHSFEDRLFFWVKQNDINGLS